MTLKWQSDLSDDDDNDDDNEGPCVDNPERLEVNKQPINIGKEKYDPNRYSLYLDSDHRLMAIKR
jgi:hypothetical protein